MDDPRRRRDAPARHSPAKLTLVVTGPIAANRMLAAQRLGTTSVAMLATRAVALGPAVLPRYGAGARDLRSHRLRGDGAGQAAANWSEIAGGGFAALGRLHFAAWTLTRGAPGARIGPGPPAIRPPRAAGS
jgi:hypothetical protein